MKGPFAPPLGAGLAEDLDVEGQPIWSDIMPGNTADLSVLLPVTHRLRGRFGIFGYPGLPPPGFQPFGVASSKV